MEPAAIRYKNPGAMWPNAIATRWGSTHYVTLNDGQGNKIAVFDTWVQGICAQLDLWRTSPNYKNKRFADAIATWSGHNSVPSYIAYVKARVPGITEDTVMNDSFWRGPMAIPFLKAQSGHEAGRPIPALETDWLEAQKLVMGATVQITVQLSPREQFVEDVKAFQRAHGLDVDGDVGPETWTAVKQAIASGAKTT